MRRRDGIAMITVLFVMIIVILLATTFSVVAMSERRSTASSVATEEALQLADAGTERARREVVAAFNDTFLSIDNFLLEVADENVAALSGVRSADVNGRDVHWKVLGVSAPEAPYGWIDLAATADTGSAIQTVVRRVGFGASSTFELAMLSETTNCMFCHLRVNGDVGNLVFMRPGWGNEGSSGHGSGGNASGVGESVVDGNVFAAQDVTHDGTDGGKLNGAKVTGVVERFSTNPALPTDLDGDGIADFPPIRRDVAVANAIGSIGGGTRSCAVELGGSYDGSCGTANYTGTIDGNLILEGTKENPIHIDGDVWVEGDVVIKGYVTGLGGLYAGRNIYLAGDVQSVEGTYVVDDAGRCVDEEGVVILTKAQLSATGFSPADACARRAVADQRDALRLASRGSIIVGDYTEYDADGELQSYADRQSSEFYRQQFGFDWGERRVYDAATGDELRCSGSTCLNADGETVTNTVNVDGYDGSFRPGQVDAGGFAPWLSDAQYQDILGTESFSHNTWRWEFGGNDFRTGESLAGILENLVDAGLPVESAWNVLNQRVDFQERRDSDNAYVISKDELGDFVTRAQELGLFAGSVNRYKNNRDRIEEHEGNGDWRTTTDDAGDEVGYLWSGNSLRVLYTGEREFETQVNRIDAFLYANQRIAGKTSMQAMSVNGGLIAKDLGILAPGRSLENGSFGHRYPSINDERDTACSDAESEYYVYGSEDCALTVNYDHRMRNGGYGYNIIEGRIGITLDWRVADSKNERVRP